MLLPYKVVVVVMSERNRESRMKYAGALRSSGGYMLSLQWDHFSSRNTRNTKTRNTNTKIQEIRRRTAQLGPDTCYHCIGIFFLQQVLRSLIPTKLESLNSCGFLSKTTTHLCDVFRPCLLPGNICLFVAQDKDTSV